MQGFEAARLRENERFRGRGRHFAVCMAELFKFEASVISRLCNPVQFPAWKAYKALKQQGTEESGGCAQRREAGTAGCGEPRPEELLDGGGQLVRVIYAETLNPKN